jgi:hypothetical protein
MTSSMNNQDYVYVNYFPETNQLNCPTRKYDHIDLISLRESLLENDKDYLTILKKDERYKFIMKTNFIVKLSNEEIIKIFKEIISTQNHKDICPCYISYNENETYHWLDNDFKNKFENKLFFATLFR